MLKSLSLIFEDEDNDGNDKNILESIRKFLKGQISEFELEESDPHIDWVKKMYPIGKSRVYPKMTQQEFYEKLDLSEEDSWAIDRFSGGYPSYYDDFSDYSSNMDSFQEDGYILRLFDDDNKETLRNISKIILPGYKFNLNDAQYRGLLANRLLNFFSSYVETIVTEYTGYENQAIWDSVQKAIKEEFWDTLSESGFSTDFNGDNYFDISSLVMWIRYFEYEGNFEGLLDKIFNQLQKKIRGGWWEDYYNYYDDDYFDKDGFNREIYKVLNTIEDELLENENFAEITKKIDDITKKFKMREWYRIPKNPENMFQITEIDALEEKIDILISTNMGIKRKILKIDDFWNFLYNFELFDNEY